MNDYLIVILIVLGAVPIAVLGFIRHRNRVRTDYRYLNMQRIEAVAGKVAYTTPGGREVFTSLKLDPKMLVCLDLAWKLKDAALKANGYPPENFAPGKVFVLPSIREVDAGGNYSPAFQTWIDPSNSYYNSDWDQLKGWKPSFWKRLLGHKPTHYILAAEWVVDLDQNTTAVAEYKRDWTNCRNAVFHGDEHCALKRLDPDRFYLTADHSETGGHPILFCDQYNEPVVL